MQTSSPHPAIDLATPLYYQLVYTLTDLLPPPLDDTPEALLTRNHAAIAKVAALLPVNADEADLAAQCIAALAQAEDLLRLLRQNAGDIGLVLRLNAQHGSMVRTSLSVHGRLMRVQALRHKREKIGTAVNADAWALHVAEQSMLAVVNADSAPPATEQPKMAPVATQSEAPPDTAPVATPPESTPVEAPAPYVDQRVADNVSETGTNSQYAAFETWLSQQPWTQRSKASDKTGPRETMAESPPANPRSGGQKSPANGRETSRRAN